MSHRESPQIRRREDPTPRKIFTPERPRFLAKLSLPRTFGPTPVFGSASRPQPNRKHDPKSGTLQQIGKCTNKVGGLLKSFAANALGSASMLVGAAFLLQVFHRLRHGEMVLCAERCQGKEGAGLRSPRAQVGKCGVLAGLPLEREIKRTPHQQMHGKEMKRRHD